MLFIVAMLTFSCPKRAHAQTYQTSEERDRRPHREVTITNSPAAQTTVIFRTPRGHAASARTAALAINPATPTARPEPRSNHHAQYNELPPLQWRHR